MHADYITYILNFIYEITEKQTNKPHIPIFVYSKPIGYQIITLLMHVLIGVKLIFIRTETNHDAISINTQ